MILTGAPASAAGTVGASDIAAALADLAPHRAVYEMRLVDADRNADLASLDGRLVYDLSGDACEGHAVTFRYVSRLTTKSGGQALTDIRATTHETYDGFERSLEESAVSNDGSEASPGGRFRFLTRTLIDDRVSDEARGTAVRNGAAERDGGPDVTVALREPEPADLSLGARPLFPTGHLAHLIAAARRGERFLDALIYDGGEGGREVSDTVAAIGLPKAPRANGPEGVRGLVAWPVSLSYYDVEADASGRGSQGDAAPSYTVRFDLYENGVNDALELDYGDFRVAGTLQSLEPMPGGGGC